MFKKTKYPVNLILGQGTSKSYDGGHLAQITPEMINSIAFGTRQERKAFLNGLSLGLKEDCARLLATSDVQTIHDMNDLSELQHEINTLNPLTE